MTQAQAQTQTQRQTHRNRRRQGYRQLESQAGEPADTIADTSQRIKNVGSDTRNIEAFTQAVQGVAAGFQLAQGAAGLFGQENEDVQVVVLMLYSSCERPSHSHSVLGTINSLVLYLTLPMALNVA